MQATLKHRIEYALLRFAAAIVRPLPYRGALAVGWIVAAIGFHVARWRRAEAERRIRQVFGDRYDAAQIRRIAWLSFRDLVFHAVEILYAPRMDEPWLAAYTNAMQERGKLLAHLKGGKGAIFAVAHLGNWDAAGLAAELLGIPTLVIAREQKNPLVNAFLNRMRALHDSVVVERSDPDLLTKVVQWLAAGKVVAILIDLRTGRNAATFSFLGHETRLGRGVGVIARQSGAPVVPVVTLRQGCSQHRWVLKPPLFPDPALDRKSDSIRITAACLEVFDAAIRRHPEQYFWYNKKWLFPISNENRN